MDFTTHTEHPPISGHTRLTCLLGSPVSHSISPLMHNEAFRYLGLDYVYLCFDVKEAGMEAAVNGLRTLNAAGFNCTMPDKTRMCELADRLSPAAEMTGAVNTVVNENGCLTGHNTDGIGYMSAVREAGYDIIGKQMTLLGCGGAATAIAVQAALDGVSKLHIFSRKGASFQRAVALADRIHARTACRVEVQELRDRTALKTAVSESAILTNATPLGMSPNEDACPIPDKNILYPELIVSDIIYNPRQTKLMTLAAETGCRTFNGLYMLLFQGAEAFRLWTGHDMPLEHIKETYFQQKI